MESIETDEDDAIVGAVATSVLTARAAIILAYENQSNIPRAPYTNKDQEREFYMNSILNGSIVHCDCVGEIDGTHVLASVPIEHQNRYRGRKSTTTQNVLAAVSFNLKFTYVLADKYYLLDAEYGLRKGFISPYHGVRYHLQEYSDRPPQNEKELFNIRHASLRSVVERAFAILKRWFRVIDNEPFWDFKTQVDVVLSSCILHNHRIDLEPNDPTIQEADGQPLVQTQNAQITQSSQRSQTYQTPRERREEARECSLKRDAIAHAMFTNYDRRRNR
ncbi:uncharacterized protein LOC142172594 [Nicotiana tabacum]|uniref:Uncharacterized protein LOC142172594 n=1 Tax=Nicotiana tabacum TaxID=4097 RepID=A0AC58T538_TOBAC